jgi:hypothetical protein
MYFQKEVPRIPRKQRDCESDRTGENDLHLTPARFRFEKSIRRSRGGKDWLNHIDFLTPPPPRLSIDSSNPTSQPRMRSMNLSDKSKDRWHETLLLDECLAIHGFI